MIHLLAQTSQPIDMKHWTPENIAYLLGIIIPCVLAILAYMKSTSATQTATDSKEVSIAANDNALNAKDTATAAKAIGDVNSTRITNVSQHATAIDGKMTDLARALPPVPSPEAMGKAFNAADGKDVT
jgi:hypothetical protein